MSAELVCAATDPAWLDKRREGITATDIVTIAGLVTWDSPWALYHRKLGLLPEPEQSDRMRLGLWLERNIADTWACAAISPLGWVREGGLYRSAERNWQMATLDRVILAKRSRHLDLAWEQPPIAVLECKTWDERQGKHEWGPDGSDQVPAKVRAQVLWQMDTLGVGAGHVAVVFLPSGEFRSYTIRHDENNCLRESGVYDVGCIPCDDIQGLRDLGFGFWSRILTRCPPDLDGLEVTTDALRYLHPAPGEQVELAESGYLYAEHDYLTNLYDESAADKKFAEAEHRRIQNLVREAMGDATEATVDGRVVFRRTIGKRAGYTVAPAETDILRRIGKDKD